jgi:septation ring formation regulator EzrA
MSKTLEAIHTLEDRLKTLLTNYEFLKEENEILLENVNKLQHQLILSQQDLENQKKSFDVLKVAKTINGSKENTRETKLTINALIREIDKCIVQLNE